MNVEGKVIWITGLSGAGKTTLATAVVDLLRKEGVSPVLLDGDELRSVLVEENSGGRHDRESRLELAFKYSKLCKVIAKQGFIVVIATISLFREIHEWNRKNLPGYLEVFLDVPMEELKRRDPKKIYQRYQSGEVRDVVGLDLKAQIPKNSDVRFKYDGSISPAAMAEIICQKLKSIKLNEN